MNWIITGKKGKAKDEEWLEYFDAVSMRALMMTF